MGEYLVALLSELFGQDEYLFGQSVLTFLGWLNVLLALIAGSLFLSRRINKYFFSNKNQFLRKLMKPLSKIHPYVGVVLLISAYLHGDLALGTIFRIHTGPLAWWILLLMMFVALIGKKYRIKNWLKVHRTLATLFAISILLHLFARNLL